MAGDSRQLTGLEIAVTGMTGRYPGANSVDELWNLLRDGVEPQTEFSEQELVQHGTDPALLNKTDFVRSGFVLNDIELFDANFFSYTPMEAEILDPQQRLFLECAHQALEIAGCDPETYAGAIGVFAGTTLSSYLLNNLMPRPELLQQLGPVQLSLANDKDYLATRVAYKLNLEGPALTIQTACSTSLVAIHTACQSLLAGECDMALAGGVSINTRQKAGYLYQEGGIASRDGHCRPFDADSSGTVGSNGVGIVVLKRLEDAIEDGDNIDAVILGSAINNDGSRKIGFTAPRIEGQARAIESAQRMAEINPDDIGYIEAHGTGTQLGDPIEITALTRVFRKTTERKQYCAIGSIKSNFGHLDAAAGVAGFTKAALALKHKEQPPSLNFEQPNPQIDFNRSPFFVNTGLRQWQSEQSPRYAGVSSFGLGGTNAHVVLGEAPVKENSDDDEGQQLLVLSARTETALETATENLADYLDNNPDTRLADVAWTLQTGRTMYEHRRVLVAYSNIDAAEALTKVDSNRVSSAVGERVDSDIVFMFSGQGSQYPGMTRELYQDFDVFRKSIDQCCEYLKTQKNIDLYRLLYPAEDKAGSLAEELKQTVNAQCALTAVEYALAQLWISLGVIPKAMIGHSIGEYVAASIAGVFSIEDALDIVSKRGELMQALEKGAMLSVTLRQDEISGYLNESVDIAVINSPQLCVISGPIADIDELESRLTAKGVNCQRLHTSHAFHSAMMEPMLQELTEYIRDKNRNPPEIPYISNLTGTWITEEQAQDPDYWASHVRNTVQFSKGIKRLLQNETLCMVEIGPGNTLASLVKQHPDWNREHTVLSSVRHAREQQNDSTYILNNLGKLWLSGVRPDWKMLHVNSKRKRVILPTYPFERKRYWIDGSTAYTNVPAKTSEIKKNNNINEWFYAPVWKSFPKNNISEHDENSLSRNWLILSDECGYGEELASHIEQNGGSVILLESGTCFSKTGNGRYTVNPACKKDFQSLLNEPEVSSVQPDRIIHAWGLGYNENSDVNPVLDRCYYSLLYLFQAIERKWLTPRLRIDVVTNNTLDVNGEENLIPGKATAQSLSKVISQEFPSIKCRYIDIEPLKEDSREESNTFYALLGELTNTDSEHLVAYRNNRRWIQSYEKLNTENKRPINIREQGVYLITGGLGEVGMVMAQYLVRTAKARLLLTGHSELPEREKWGQWLADHPENDRTVKKINNLKRLEELGADFIVDNVDVTDRSKMRMFIEKAKKRFGEINGVIHAAGIIEGSSFSLLHNIDHEHCETQFHAKIHGLLVLKEIFENQEPDFVMAVSSLSSVLGGLGMTAYAAANQYMDTYCRQQNCDSNTKWLSVNWEGWDFSDEKKNTKPGNTISALAIIPDEGAVAFENVLRISGETQVIVSSADLTERLRQWVISTSDDEQTSYDEAESFSRPELTSQLVRPETETQEKIAAMWQELFNIGEIGIHDNFFELGGHSLLAIQIVSKLRDTLNAEITLDKFLELGTVSSIASYIDNSRSQPLNDNKVSVAEYDNEREEFEL